MDATYEDDTLNVIVTGRVTVVTIENDRKLNVKNKTLENNVTTMFSRREFFFQNRIITVIRTRGIDYDCHRGVTTLTKLLLRVSHNR